MRRKAINHGEGKPVRKAYASKGDDCTYTRFIRTRRDPPPRTVQPRDPRRDNSFRLGVETGRTAFRSRVIALDDMRTVLVSGHSNVKIGRDVRAGRRFRGYWIYTLSLEERATCPSTCRHWSSCYGNNIPLAKRVDHSDAPALFERLEGEIARLVSMPPRRGVRRAGLLVRLHALGDFFSVEYVEFWRDMLARYPDLAAFGYTAWHKVTEIGDAIERVKLAYPERFRIRWSDGGEARDCTVSIGGTDECPPDAFVCPDELGKVEGCGKCGACWAGTKNVAFVAH